MKRKIKINESTLKRIVINSVNRIINEGSIIHGTYREQDIVPALLDFLKTEHPDVYDEFAESHPDMISAIGNENSSYWNSDQSSLDYHEDLYDTMQDLSPDGHYFGSHIGDASDIGYWPNDDNDEALNESIRKNIHKAIRKYVK